MKLEEKIAFLEVEQKEEEAVLRATLETKEKEYEETIHSYKVTTVNLIIWHLIICPTRLWQPVNNLVESWKLGCHNLVGHITRCHIMEG